MISVEVDWDGKKGTVLLKSPTRKHRKEYLEWMDSIDSGEKTDFKIMSQFLAWREELTASLILSSPFAIGKDNLDDVPLDVLNTLCKAVESNMVLTKDFQTPSSGPPTPSTEQKTDTSNN